MRLKHRNFDSQAIDSTRHFQFGTRGSEVRILSPRPLESTTDIIPDTVKQLGFPKGFPLCDHSVVGEATSGMAVLFLSSSFGSANTASTIRDTASTRSFHHVFEYTSNVMLSELPACRMSRATSRRAPKRRIRLACMVRKLRKSIVLSKPSLSAEGFTCR